MKQEKKWSIVSLASIPLVKTLGNSMLIPVLPTIEKKLNISSFQVSMIITLYSIVAIILIPIAGYLSDRIGRKKVIIPSLIIAGVGGIISGWAAWKMKDPYWLILVGRIFQGVGAAGAAPVVMPLVGDLFKSEKEVSKELGVIETSNTFGKVLSPILGSLLAGLVWFLPFFAIPVFTLISVLLMIFLVESPKKKKKPVPFKKFLKQIKKIFKKSGRWLYAIFAIGCILMFVLFGVLFYLSSMLEDQHGIDGIKKGLILAIPLASLCLASYFTGKKIKENKVLMKWITVSGIALLAISVFAISFTENIYFLLGIFFICGVGIGVALPCLDSLITEGVEKEERGTITSIYSSMRFIGVAAGPPVFVLLMKASHQVMYYSITGLCMVAGLIALKEIKPKKAK
ncbi:MFS transporter [Bacillus mesophilus]|uniref:MFS transporter n=1 Tax=Bacillus mesophilus TaxID=1808955 RepID=A0A6M0Q517_9BACI|nr:MFS transporter [Bacillus mesophilus]NEY70530.1 MFS transporter [Bacillus mesophilus]